MRAELPKIGMKVAIYLPQEHLHRTNTKLNGSSCQHELKQEKMKEAPSFEGASFIFGARQKRAPSIVSESTPLYQHAESRFIKVLCLESANYQSLGP